MTKLTTCLDKIEAWIIDDMGGSLDKSDPFFPAWKQIQILREKIEVEEKEGMLN